MLGAYSSKLVLFTARLVFMVHILVMLLFLVGPVLIWYVPVFAVLQVIVLAVTLFFHITYGICPLTSIEKKLLVKGRGYSYSTAFYKYYFFGKLLRWQPSDNFVRQFLIYVKIMPSLISLLLLAIVKIAS
jgi:hypothetical protein